MPTSIILLSQGAKKPLNHSFGFRGCAATFRACQARTLYSAAHNLTGLQTLKGRTTGATTQRIQITLWLTRHGVYDIRRAASCQAGPRARIGTIPVIIQALRSRSFGSRFAYGLKVFCDSLLGVFARRGTKK